MITLEQHTQRLTSVDVGLKQLPQFFIVLVLAELVS